MHEPQRGVSTSDSNRQWEAEQDYYRWLDEMEDRIFGPQSRDPRRLGQDERQAAPAHANARVEPQ